MSLPGGEGERARPFPLWIGALGAVLLGSTARSGLGERPPDAILAIARAGAERLDPSRMNARQLRRLPGIGDGRAAAVVRARRGHAGRSPLAWSDIEGIGPKIEQRIREWLEERGACPDFSSGFSPDRGSGARSGEERLELREAPGAVLDVVDPPRLEDR